MHISAQLIKSFPMAYGSWSCAKEKLLIPLEAHHVGSSSEIVLSFHAKKEELLFLYLLAHPAETAFLSFRGRELSNDVWLVQVRPRKVVVHIFLGVVTAQADQTAFVPELSKAVTFLSYVVSW